MKRISFFDGFDSSTTPTTENLDTSLLVKFATDAAYVVVYGTATLGFIYYNTTDNLIHYYNGSAWITLNDHTSLLNKGTTTHANIDTHIADSTKHFLMLDEDGMTSNDATKTITQQSAKAYMDANSSSLNSFIFTETISAGAPIRVVNDAGTAKVSKVSNPATDFFGIAQEAGTVGTTHTVALVGKISTVHSGKTPGDIAYVQTDGTLGATVTAYPAGRYISATSLLITQNP